MKTKIFLISLVVTTYYLLHWNAATNQKSLALEVPAVIDFGLMAPREVQARDILIKNITKAKHQVSRLQASCGCTRIEISHDFLEPGDVTTAHVTVRARPTLGYVSEQVSIWIDNNEQPASRIKILGQVSSPLAISPDRVYFGTIQQAILPVDIDLVIQPGSLKTIPSDLLIQSDQSYVSAQYRHDASTENGMTLRVRLEKSTPCGDIGGALYVKSSYLQSSIPIRYGAKVTGVLEANPSDLFCQFDSKSTTSIERFMSVEGIDARKLRWRILPNSCTNLVEIHSTSENAVKVTFHRSSDTTLDTVDGAIIGVENDIPVLSVPFYYDTFLQK